MKKIIEKIVRLKNAPIVASLITSPIIFTGLWALCAPLGIEGGITTFFIILLISLLFSSWSYIFFNSKFNSNYKRYFQSIEQNSPNKNTYGIIGIIAPISYWATQFYINIIRGIREESERRIDDYRHQIVVFDVQREEFTERIQGTINTCITAIDALININMDINDNFRASLIQANIPLINIHHRDATKPSISSLLPDHEAFQELISDLIISKQCKSVVFITKPLENKFKSVKVDEFRKEKRDIVTNIARMQNFKITNQQIDGFDGTIEENYVYIIEVEQYYASYGNLIYEKIIGKNYPRVVAMVFLADDVAVEFLRCCNRSGQTLSQLGLRISGFDNSEIAKAFDLTSIDYSLQAVGRAAYAEVEAFLSDPHATTYSEKRIKAVLRKGVTTEW